MTGLFNREDQKDRRRELRSQMPQPELQVWKQIRNKQLNGYRFRRQYSVGPYILDFYCPTLKLAIEIDGETHFTDEAPQQDQERQEFVESKGIIFLRFTNIEVKDNLEGVLETILHRTEQLQSR